MNPEFRLRLLLLMFAAILFSGCASTRSKIYTTPTLLATDISVTVTPTKTPFPISEPTETATTIPLEPTTTPTPLSSESALQLTYVSDRPCQSCLYGIASALYAMQVGCLDTEVLCFGEPQLLFEWNKWIGAVDWSPDGKRLVFESEGQLYLADWNGENATQIPIPPGHGNWPRWSPDGKQIAYIFLPQRPGSEALDPSQIMVYSLETGVSQHIFQEAYDPNQIYWLDGEYLAYVAKVSETDWTETINIVSPDGMVVKQIPGNAKDYTHISYFDISPGGHQAVFVGTIIPQVGNITNDVYAFSLDENNVINLTNGYGRHNYTPVWSPLGNWIAFESDRSGEFQIYLIKPDGTGLVQVTEGPMENTIPDWRMVR